MMQRYSTVCVVGIITEQLKRLQQASLDVRDVHTSMWDRHDMQHLAPVEFNKDDGSRARSKARAKTETDEDGTEWPSETDTCI